jgi:antirestriction protein ArdC
MSRAYDQIAERLLAMTNDAGDWQPCWHRAGLVAPTNRLTANRYRGINVLSLWVETEMRGYQTSEWATFKQWLELGQCVRKGEKGTPVVYWGEHRKDKEDGTSEAYKFAKGAYVFNLAQVDPLPDQEPLLAAGQTAATVNPDGTIPEIEGFVERTGARVIHCPTIPCYVPALDEIRMPPWASFHHGAGYYGTLMHELTHWTRAKHRLNRNWDHDQGERARYALEELVAELGAAFLCADLGIEAEPREDHAQYLKHWHAALKNDVPAFMAAVGMATKAAAYLHNLQEAEREAA